jgi:hypothetical protein
MNPLDPLSPLKVNAKVEISSKDLISPVNKLFEAVRAGCGLWYEPVHVVRMEKAHSTARLIAAQTDLQIAALRTSETMLVEDQEGVGSIEVRAENRVKVQNVRRQQNIDATVMKAIDYLPPEVSDRPTDPDLFNRIFDGCQDVSDPDMQSYWAKLTAGEVARPGTFSRRTIGLLKEMGKADADLFEKACSVLWFHESLPAGAFIPVAVTENMPELLNGDESLALDAMGILHVGMGVFAVFQEGSILRCGSQRFRVGRENGLASHLMTSAAQELVRLSRAGEADGFLEKSKHWVNAAFSLTPLDK